MPFGLLSTTSVQSTQSNKYRRKIFRQYPTGAAPLTGLLSMMPEKEATDKSEFGWHEQRFPTQRTTTVGTGTAPFLNEDGTALTDLSPLLENVEYRVVVVSTDQFKPTHVISIREITLNNTTTTTYEVQGVVTRVNSATVLTFRPTSTFGTAGAGVDNGTSDNFGKTVAIIGSANRENARSGTGTYTVPTQHSNYTQIFRTAFNVSRTALKGGLVHDSRGPWRTQAYDNGLRHMIEMEKAFFFGRRHEALVADPETGEVTPERKTGGLVWFMEQWEAANSIYRGGTGAAAVTDNADDNKRIIDVGGTLSKADYNKYISRAFKRTNDKAYEKLCLCGGSFLDTVNTLFERDTLKQVDIAMKGTNVEFIVLQHTTLRGTIYYKVHPLLDDDPDYVDGAFILDMSNMGYRPLQDSDTELLSGRQESDRDGRKDEWLTECGLELQFPESFMLIKNAAQAA